MCVCVFQILKIIEFRFAPRALSVHAPPAAPDSVDQIAATPCLIKCCMRGRHLRRITKRWDGVCGVAVAGLVRTVHGLSIECSLDMAHTCRHVLGDWVAVFGGGHNAAAFDAAQTQIAARALHHSRGNLQADEQYRDEPSAGVFAGGIRSLLGRTRRSISAHAFAGRAGMVNGGVYLIDGSYVLLQPPLVACF